MKIYLVIGVPGSGKSWVCEQLRHLFRYVRHDDYMYIARKDDPGGGYLNAIRRAAVESDKPLLIETPFSVSKLLEPLEADGHDVTPVFIIEREAVIAQRYRARDGKDIPRGHLTRLVTYAARADEYGAFKGTSTEVLAHLRAAGDF